MIDLGKKKLSQFAARQVGLDAAVLFEKKEKKGFYWGYTPNFVRVKMTASELQKLGGPGIRQVKINAVEQETLTAVTV